MSESTYQDWINEAGAAAEHGDKELEQQCLETAESFWPDLDLCLVYDDRNPRRRVRTCDVEDCAQYPLNKAVRSSAPYVSGGVANAYKYRAWTQCCVCVAYPDTGLVVVWAGEVFANKVTEAAIITSLVSERFRALADYRYTEAKRAQAARDLCSWARLPHLPAELLSNPAAFGPEFHDTEGGPYWDACTGLVESDTGLVVYNGTTKVWDFDFLKQEQPHDEM